MAVYTKMTGAFTVPMLNFEEHDEYRELLREVFYETVDAYIDLTYNESKNRYEGSMYNTDTYIDINLDEDIKDISKRLPGIEMEVVLFNEQSPEDVLKYKVKDDVIEVYQSRVSYELIRKAKL